MPRDFAIGVKVDWSDRTDLLGNPNGRLIRSHPIIPLLSEPFLSDRLIKAARLTDRRLVPLLSHSLTFVAEASLFMNTFFAEALIMARPVVTTPIISKRPLVVTPVISNGLFFVAPIISSRTLLTGTVVPRPLVSTRTTTTATAPASPAPPSAIAILIAIPRRAIR
jgi:hypothetical protein